MKKPEYSSDQDSIVIIAFLVMGFVAVIALIFRPTGSLELKFGEYGPKLSVDEQPKTGKPPSKNP